MRNHTTTIDPEARIRCDIVEGPGASRSCSSTRPATSSSLSTTVTHCLGVIAIREEAP